MRALVKSLAPILAAMILGGGAVFWWDRYHPETNVYYDEKTTSIPATAGMRYDTFTEVTVWNASPRVRATALGVLVRVPTASPVEIGDIESPEDKGTLSATVQGPRAGVSEVSLRAARLAPRSKVTIPIWWRRRGRTSVTVTGTSDQCVVTRAPTDVSTSVWWLLVTWTSVGLFFVAAYAAVGFKRIAAAALRGNTELLAEMRRMLREDKEFFDRLLSQADRLAGHLSELQGALEDARRDLTDNPDRGKA